MRGLQIRSFVGASRLKYTPITEVGLRELRGRLSDYLAGVREGDEPVVTDRGKAFARIAPIAGGRALDRAVAEGLCLPPPPQHDPGPLSGFGVPARQVTW